MPNDDNIKNLAKKASISLLDTIYLLELLTNSIEDCNTSEVAILTLGRIIKDNVKSAFENLENCRKMITIEE